MNPKAELARESLGNDLGGFLALVSTRLKRLRRQRQLVERAINALTVLSRTRQSRAQQARKSGSNRN
jgi:hypothetical protein